MFGKFFLINAGLFAIIGLLSFKLYDVWTRPIDIPVNPPEKKLHGKMFKSTRNKKKKPFESQYEIIVEKNLFHPTRTSKANQSKRSKPISKREKPQLFGTVIQGKEQLAILEDPVTKKTKLYGINDAVAGFVITDILVEKVLLEKDGKSIQLGLRDDKTFRRPRKVRKPQKRGTRTRRVRRRR